ncbi:MAG: hypothetical protein HY718_20770 [Planctomycetes bacterium]|nr:hypothetical protein [Planctomycetota bacterium]
MSTIAQGAILQLESRRAMVDESETGIEGDPQLVLVASPPSDPTPEQFMKAIEASGVLDFWGDPKEDIYSVDDGEPV